MGHRWIFDIETDGLLKAEQNKSVMTRVHCVVLRNIDTNDVLSFADHRQTQIYPDIPEAFPILAEASLLVAHNGIYFDQQALYRQYPEYRQMFPQVLTMDRFVDTMVCSRVIWSNIKDGDFDRNRRGQFPAHLLFEPHSLEAWGWRFGNRKGEYKGGWERWNQEMHDYCIQDTSVTLDLYRAVVNKGYSKFALMIEHELAWYLAQQKINGFKFDSRGGAELYATICALREPISQSLRERFGWWYEAGEEKTPKKTLVYVKNEIAPRTITAGAPYTKLEQVFFKPGSRDHIANRLMKLYGWEPKEFGDDGKPTLDDDIISGLQYPEIPEIRRLLLFNKRIGQIAEGKQAWLKVEQDGWIFGNVNQSGAITHRATHSWPNLTQVPAVQKSKDDKPLMLEAGGFGWECRSLFGVPEGWTLVGADASGLELRCLSHFMAPYDGGAYRELILNGDVHTANWNAGKPYLTTRAVAKTFIYAFLYGAGDWKLGNTCDPSLTDDEKTALGALLRKTFLKNVPALKMLVDAVQHEVKTNKCFKLPTGHIVYIRKMHAALNSLLQGTGAVICKLWIVLANRELQKAGLRHGWTGDYAACVWAHDEVQVASRTPEIAKFAGETLISVFPRVTELLKFQCPLEGQYKLGLNWAETH
jgi:DNA polymerase I